MSTERVPREYIGKHDGRPVKCVVGDHTCASALLIEIAGRTVAICVDCAAPALREHIHTQRALDGAVAHIKAVSCAICTLAMEPNDRLPWKAIPGRFVHAACAIGAEAGRRAS